MAYKQAIVVPSAARTANGQGLAVGDFGDPQHIRAQLNVTAVSGTTPNLVVLLEDSLDGVNWNTLITFAAKTAVGREVLSIDTGHGAWLRASWTITGTTPSFTFDVFAIGQ